MVRNFRYAALYRETLRAAMVVERIERKIPVRLRVVAEEYQRAMTSLKAMLTAIRPQLDLEHSRVATGPSRMRSREAVEDRARSVLRMLAGRIGSWVSSHDLHEFLGARRGNFSGVMKRARRLAPYEDLVFEFNGKKRSAMYRVRERDDFD